jgi:FKBP-type peptidyl-prolyl cis-trans isomerase
MRFPRPRLSRVALLAAATSCVLLACGEDTIDGPQASSAGSSVDTAADVASTVAPASAPPATEGSPTALPKPEVDLPAELPTELVVTSLEAGSGDAAQEGDTLVIHYVGVRSADGAEFDNSFDRGSPISVVLGQQRVIAGWEQGLLGAQQGARLQLDIPADLAYGDSPPDGEVIQAGDALSFILDVVAIVAPSDPADKPDIAIAGAANQAEIDIEDLVEGTGPVLQAGQGAAIQIVAYRADTGVELSSSWEGGAPFTFDTDDSTVLPGIRLAVEDMAVGGRRQVAVPFQLAFGEAGNESFGLPAQTDMVLVVDLVAVY